MSKKSVSILRMNQIGLGLFTKNFLRNSAFWIQIIVCLTIKQPTRNAYFKFTPQWNIPSSVQVSVKFQSSSLRQCQFSSKGNFAASPSNEHWKDVDSLRFKILVTFWKLFAFVAVHISALTLTDLFHHEIRIMLMLHSVGLCWVCRVPTTNGRILMLLYTTLPHTQEKNPSTSHLQHTKRKFIVMFCRNSI